MNVHYLCPLPEPDEIIEAARIRREQAWADLHAELAHDAELEDARSVVREGAVHIDPARLDAAIATLRTGDAYDRYVAEQLAEARTQRYAPALPEDLDRGDHSDSHPAGAAGWLFAALLAVLAFAALIFWAGTTRAARPAACEFMTPSECIAWAQEQDGAR